MVGPPIRTVLAPNPSYMTGQGTNTYLIGSDQLAVIDPGPDLPEHLEAILDQAGSAAIRAILVTHHHGDHLPAARPLAALTGAPLYGHADLPGVQRVLDDDQVLAVADFHLRALSTPGHTPESQCYLLEEARMIFCGDLMAGSGTVIVGSGEGELADYLTSLRRLLALAPERILPGHGPTMENPAAKITEYLDHRQLREDQVLAALAAEPCSIADLRAAIYPDVPPAIAWAAENNLRAHLLKLRTDGRANLQNEAWSIADPQPFISSGMSSPSRGTPSLPSGPTPAPDRTAPSSLPPGLRPPPPRLAGACRRTRKALPLLPGPDCSPPGGGSGGPGKPTA